MMLHRTRFISLSAGILTTVVAMAQATPPAGAPAGATGLCTDGSYWTGATKRGACHGHKGVQDWYAAADGAGAAAAPAATAQAPAAAVAPTPAQAPAAPKTTKGGPAPTVAQAPGGGPGLVWVNSSSKVYHCPTDKWYGKTKNGAYMSEAQAKAQGNRPDHGKACQ